MAIHLPVLLLLLPLLPVLILILKGQKQLKRPPGPPGLPIIGNLHQLGSHPHRTLSELSKKHGPLMQLQLGSVPAVVVSSAQMAEEVLKTHDLQLCSRPTAMASLKRLSYNFSNVAFSPYNSTWRELRKMIVVNLLSPKVVEGFRPVREEEVEKMVRSISYLASLSESVNLSSTLQSLSSNIVCRVAFGKSFSGEVRGDQKNNFRIFLKESQALLMGFFVGDYFPWARWVDVLSGLQARLEKNFTELDAFYQEVIAAHKDPTRPTNDEEDFVDVLLRLQKEGEDAHLTEDQVKGVLADIFVAGTDTATATLEYAMAELMRNPTVMSRAQEEVRRAVWEKVTGDQKRVEESDIPKLCYLKSVVKETLRLHPVAPLLIPHEATALVNVHGYDILPKTRVIVNAWAIGRDSDSWDKPDEFFPERFMDSAVDFTGHHFQFIPFGAGRRICPGLGFGIMTVELALANLLYFFDWELPEGTREEGIDMNEATGITVHLKASLQLKATVHVAGMD